MLMRLAMRSTTEGQFGNSAQAAKMAHRNPDGVPATSALPQKVYRPPGNDGMVRFMNPSKSGTVNAVSPWAGL